MPVSIRLASIPAVARHGEPTPFALDGVEEADVYEFFCHLVFSSPVKLA
jgi:hypothetical protein